MDDATPTISSGASRRAVLAAAAGGVGAWLASALGRAAPVAAADGDVVHVGDNLTGSETTQLTVTTSGFSALWGNASATTGPGVGVRGDTASAASGAAGVLGIGPVVGVLGNGGGRGVRGVGNGIGVQGESPGGLGVSGVSTSGKGVEGVSAGSTGVAGLSTTGDGVDGRSRDGIGVVGRQWNHGTGVAGFSLGSQSSLLSARPKTGVYGEAVQDAASRGVWGASSSGQGVRGEATIGVGVSGNAADPAGYAFRGSGRVRFDKVSGVATIPAGSTSVTVTPGVDVTGDSFVLLTAKSNIGSRSLYFSTDTTNNRITIRMSSSRTSSTSIAWLLLR